MTEERPESERDPAAAQAGAPTAPEPGAPDATGGGRERGEAQTQAPAREPRRLRRSRDGRVIAGVSGGIGEYLSVDPVFVRIGFVLLAIFGGGAGILLYVIAWIVMPEGPSEAAAGTPAEAASRGGGVPLGAVTLGILLVIVGVVWLLRTLDVPTLGLDVVLAIALLVVGVALIAGARRGRHGGLLALGVMLTVVLTAISAVDVNMHFRNGFGDRLERPSSVAELDDGYSHVFGSLTVDLRGLDLPRGVTEIDISVVFGSVRVLLPDDAAVRVNANAVFGSADVLGGEISGVANERTFTTRDFDTARSRLLINLSTVFGSAEVHR